MNDSECIRRKRCPFSVHTEPYDLASGIPNGQDIYCVFTSNTKDSRNDQESLIFFKNDL